MTHPIKRYRPSASLIWVCTVLFSFLWNQADDVREKREIALETARAFLTHIVAVRSWNAEHGGVFVFTDEKNPVNLYMPEDQKSLMTSDGRQLTRINPAYMTRQIAEIADRQSKIRFHLTSLDPIRPENKAVDWEEQWMKEFEQGVAEKSLFVDSEEGEVFRYMAPLRVTGACLPCHDGYIPGELRGGISVSLPLHFRKSAWPLRISHLVAAIMGLVVIHFFATRLEARSSQLRVANQRLLQEIAEHKQSAQELVKIKEELEYRVTSRTKELRRTNALLDARIKEQQQVEKALVEINDEFIQIFNSAPDGMHIIDRDFTVIRANRAFMALTGHSSETITGRKCFEVFPGQLCHTADCPLTRILAGEDRVEVESQKSKTDGSTFSCVVTATPFRAPSGKLIGIIEVSRDITSWKDAERALSQAAQDLTVRNHELQDFSHVISHDLQEPLMLIQAFSQRLKTHFFTTIAEKGQIYLERIINSADRMQLLINGLLYYSRINSLLYYSRIEKESQPCVQVHLNSVIEAVLEDLIIKIEGNKAVISVDDLGTITADPLQIRQLFQNIIGNCLKYHHPDRAPEIRISRVSVPEGYDPDAYLSISVKDNGIGFKDEYQEKIFDIFQRLHTQQQIKGTGIGLSICKKIVERHHGSISATAEYGKGAEFIITLPVGKVA
jgi:PAS domain S-box-containing protein